MATGTAGTTALLNSSQQISYIRKSFTYLDGTSTMTVGTLPAGALILLPISGILVKTVFNAGTNNFSDIGITGTLEKFGSDLSLLTLAFVPLDITAANMVMAVDTPIILTNQLSGTAATTGEAEVIICFITDNDN